jgi:hypothetical protein
MPDTTTPADELRTAAQKLRSLIKDTPATPWWGDDLDEVQSPEGHVARAKANPYPTSRYIAAMHPGVGKALADWLTVEMVQLEHDDFPALHAHALAVARAINGTQQPA